MLLIVATESDPHADSVVTALKQKGVNEIFRLDLDTAASKHGFTLEAAVNGWSWTIQSRLTDRTISSQDIKSVWWRRPTAFFDNSYSAVPTTENIDAVETHWALRWAIESLPNRLFPLGHPASFRNGANKFLQLQTAAAVGFHLPPTVWSNQSKRLADFLRSFETVTVKPLHSAWVKGCTPKDTLSLWSTAISARDLAEKLQCEPTAPLYCQEMVTRVKDLRITVLPTLTVACEIDLQSMPPGMIDWRPSTLDHGHRIVEIAPSFEIQLREFLRRMGLKAGYFDFAIDAKGTPWFFECNPNAQWLWIEVKTYFPLSESIADTLMST